MQTPHKYRFAASYPGLGRYIKGIIPAENGNINIFSKNQKILKKMLAFFRKVCYHI